MTGIDELLDSPRDDHQHGEPHQEVEEQGDWLAAKDSGPGIEAGGQEKTNPQPPSSIRDETITVQIVERIDSDDVTQSKQGDGIGGEAAAAEVPPLDALVPVADSYPSPVVQNIIASVHLGQELDLRTIAVSARNAEYNPKKVNAVIMRIRDPKSTGLLYRCGRMMVTGAREEEDARLGARKMAKICQRADHPNIRFCGFRVENMIATVNCRFPVRLEGLAYNHREYCSYEPELSPGLVYRYNPQDNKIVLLFFVSGKVIITGCKSREEIHNVFQNVYPVLYQFRK